MRGPIINRLCSSIGISKSLLSNWLGINKSTITRISNVNNQRTSESTVMLQLFIRVWNTVQNEPLPIPAINEEMRLLRVEKLRLQLEKKLLTIRQEQKHTSERSSQLSRCRFFLDKVRQESLLLTRPSVALRIDNYMQKAKKEWESLDNYGLEYEEMEIRHLIEKISLLQSLENKMKRK